MKQFITYILLSIIGISALASCDKDQIPYEKTLVTIKIVPKEGMGEIKEIDKALYVFVNSTFGSRDSINRPEKTDDEAVFDMISGIYDIDYSANCQIITNSGDIRHNVNIRGVLKKSVITGEDTQLKLEIFESQF